MGIKGLNGVIADHAPNAIKALDIKSFFGRKVAIDASMSLYQFLIAVRQQDGQQLQNETGETTSHLMGMFYRTLRIIDNGIKPLYVFDGAPPKLKSGELAKRIARNAQASADAEEAKETGTKEDVDKFSRRTVRVTKQQNEEAKLLLKLMGIPYVEAPCEAEACCAQLAKEGKVYAAASEDMDTLCFSAPVLLRHLTFSEARKEPISEIRLSKALEGLGMNMDQFIDMCILLGCDYCEPIRGIGPKKAVDLIIEHKNIETVLENIKGSRYEVPADWPFKDARELFQNPDVNPWVRVGMSPLESEMRDRMAKHKEAAAQAALEEEKAAANIKNGEDNGEVKDDDDEQMKDTSEYSKEDGDAKGSAPVLETSTDGTATGTKIEENGSSADTAIPSQVAPPSSQVKEESTETSAPTASSPAAPDTDDVPPDSPTNKDDTDAQPPPTLEPEESIDPYSTPVIPKDLSKSQNPDLPRLRVKIASLDLEWRDPDIDALVFFLCTDKGFSEDRVRSGAARLAKATKQKQQGRLDGFFKPVDSAAGAAKGSALAAGKKRKGDEKKGGGEGGKKAKVAVTKKGVAKGKAK